MFVAMKSEVPPRLYFPYLHNLTPMDTIILPTGYHYSEIRTTKVSIRYTIDLSRLFEHFIVMVTFLRKTQKQLPTTAGLP